MESLTWVQLRSRNELLMQPSPHFRQSHVSLLMFRRTGTLQPACMTLFHDILSGLRPKTWDPHVASLRKLLAGLGKDIELRHQRNPDVIFDTMRKRQSGYGASVNPMLRMCELIRL